MKPLICRACAFESLETIDHTAGMKPALICKMCMLAEKSDLYSDDSEEDYENQDSTIVKIYSASRDPKRVGNKSAENQMNRDRLKIQNELIE